MNIKKIAVLSLLVFAPSMMECAKKSGMAKKKSLFGNKKASGALKQVIKQRHQQAADRERAQDIQQRQQRGTKMTTAQRLKKQADRNHRGSAAGLTEMLQRCGAMKPKKKFGSTPKTKNQVKRNNNHTT